VKIGDLVKIKGDTGATRPAKAGLLVDTIQKKVWRTQERGPNVNWTKVDPTPHGVVLFSHNDETINIPMEDLEKA
jgi:hypothetical protein